MKKEQMKKRRTVMNTRIPTYPSGTEAMVGIGLTLRMRDKLREEGKKTLERLEEGLDRSHKSLVLKTLVA